MIYAQIKNGQVQNTILVDENTPLDLFSEGYDHFMRIDELNPCPGPTWSYDGESFSPPPIPPEPSESKD